MKASKEEPYKVLRIDMNVARALLVLRDGPECLLVYEMPTYPGRLGFAGVRILRVLKGLDNSH